MILKEINSYIFFDGVKEHKVPHSYDDWLSSCDFDVYSESFIQIDADRIALFQENKKDIKHLYKTNKKLFFEANETLNFTVEKKDNDYYKIFTNKHRYDLYCYVFEEVNQKKYLIFYSLGGSRFIESITIYKIFVIDEISI